MGNFIFLLYLNLEGHFYYSDVIYLFSALNLSFQKGELSIIIKLSILEKSCLPAYATCFILLFSLLRVHACDLIFSYI